LQALAFQPEANAPDLGRNKRCALDQAGDPLASLYNLFPGDD